MKTIRVVAAVICDSMQEKRKIYATARGYGDYNDPLGYADLILNGDPEKYLKTVTGSRWLED